MDIGKFNDVRAEKLLRELAGDELNTVLRWRKHITARNQSEDAYDIESSDEYDLMCRDEQVGMKILMRLLFGIKND